MARMENLDVVVTVIARHSKKCKYFGQKKKRKAKCRKCRLHLEWMEGAKQMRRKAGTRSWVEANERKKELEAQLKDTGRSDAPHAPQIPTVASGIVTFIAFRRSESTSTLGKNRVMMESLQLFCEKKGIARLCDLTTLMLEEWRRDWTFKPNSHSMKVHNAIAKAAFTFWHQRGLIPTNPWVVMTKIKVTKSPTVALSETEKNKVLEAVSACIPDADEAFRVRTLIRLQLASGLAAVDALILSRSALDQDNRITLIRKKMSRSAAPKPIRNILPPDVADALRMLPIIHPGYFFWAPDKRTDRSEVAWYGNHLRRIFDYVKIDRNIDGLTLSHRFRDTYVKDRFLEGYSTEEVAALIGDSVATVIRHYSCWVNERQTALEKKMRETYAKA